MTSIFQNPPSSLTKAIPFTKVAPSRKVKPDLPKKVRFVNDEGVMEEQELVVIDDGDFSGWKYEGMRKKAKGIVEEEGGATGVDIYGLPKEKVDFEFDKKLGVLGFGEIGGQSQTQSQTQSQAQSQAQSQNQGKMQEQREVCGEGREVGKEKEGMEFEMRQDNEIPVDEGDVQNDEELEKLSNYSIDTEDLENMDVDIDSDDEEEYNAGHKTTGGLEQMRVIQDKTGINHLSYNFSAHKAGLDKVDKEHVNKVITEASKGSAYYKNQQYRLRAIKNKIKRFKYRIKQFRANTVLWTKTYHDVQRRLMWFKNERSFKRTWVHVDMDMFYAAVEIKDNPAFGEVPLAVGERGIIQTTNYIARQSGVRSGMPTFIAKKLCDKLTIVRPNYVRYQEISDEMKTILREYDPDLESCGLDEANIDVTEFLMKNNLNHAMGRLWLAQRIRKTIFERLEITCSVGISCNKMMAKILSDFEKPDGCTYIDYKLERVLAFMKDLPIRKVPGIGKVIEQILNNLGIFY